MVKFIKRNEYKSLSGLKFEDNSLTQQQFKDECDVVKQIKRLARHLDYTGETLSEYSQKGAMYGDFSEIPDFLTYNKQVCDAKQRFDLLPNSIRERFNNSPERLFEFLLDENNRDEAVKLGLVNSPEIKDIQKDISTPQTDIKVPETVSSDVSDTAI